MLVELAEATDLPRGLQASLIGVSAPALRRWEDGSRNPHQAARRRIVRGCGSLAGKDGFEVADLMATDALRVAGETSRPAADRLEALQSFSALAIFKRRIGCPVRGTGGGKCESRAGKERLQPDGHRDTRRGKGDRGGEVLGPTPGLLARSASPFFSFRLRFVPHNIINRSRHDRTDAACPLPPCR